MILQDNLLDEAALLARAADADHSSACDFYLAISAVYRTLADIAAMPDTAKVLAPAA